MLRNIMWTSFYGEKIPAHLVISEIIIACIIAVFFTSFSFGFKRIIFYWINDNIVAAKYSAFVLSLSLSICWLIASLDLLGFWSAMIALIFMCFSLLVNLIYQLVTRNR